MSMVNMWLNIIIYSLQMLTTVLVQRRYVRRNGTGLKLRAECYRRNYSSLYGVKLCFIYLNKLLLCPATNYPVRLYYRPHLRKLEIKRKF